MFLTDRTYDAATLAATDVLRILRDGKPRTRVELSELLGLARATISLRVDPLIGSGLVSSVADGASTGGRRSFRMSLNSRSRVVLAADIGLKHSRVALTDLTGAILNTKSLRVDVADGPQSTLAGVLAAAEELLGPLERQLPDIVAIGIGLPSPVDTSGRPSNPIAMPGWDGFDIAGWFAGRVEATIAVANDVNIMALGEQRTAWPDTSTFLFVKVSSGIGAGIISSGMLQRGSQNIAGHIGHLPISRGAGVACRCGNEGCVTTLASGTAVARALDAQGIPAADSRDVVELVRQGNPVATNAVRQAGRDIGEILVEATAFVNPSVIAVGGSLAQAGEHLLAGMREVVYTRAMPLATENLVILQSKTAGDAGIIGASLLALEMLFSPEGVSALLARTV